MQAYQDKIVFVAGGTGAVGEGIVKHLAEQGATVIVSSRTEEKLDALRDYLGPQAEQLHGIVGNISDAAGAEAIAQQVQEAFGGVDAAVASLGGWWYGKKLLDVPVDEWRSLVDTFLTSHFVASKYLIPTIKPGGSYTFIAGFSGAEAYPQAGPVSASGAGQLMMREVYSQEIDPKQVRINDLVLGPINTRARLPEDRDPSYLTPEQIGRFVSFLAFEEGGGAITDASIKLLEQGDIEKQMEHQGENHEQDKTPRDT